MQPDVTNTTLPGKSTIPLAHGTPLQPASFHPTQLKCSRLLTKLVAVLCGGRDPFAVHLDVLAAGPAVQLVLPDLPPTQLVCHGALVPHVLVKIRRRLILPLCLQREK